MNPPKILLFLALLVVTITSTGSAQQQPASQPQKQTVSVEQTGDDPVGRQLTFAVREALRRSASFEASTPRDSLFRISIVSLDPDKEKANSGRWTVAAVVITMKNWIAYDPKDPQTWYPIYLNSLVVTSGTSAVDDSARNIVASLDAAVEEFKRQLTSH